MNLVAARMICEELQRLRQALDAAASDYAAQERRLQAIPHGRYSTAELQRMEEIKKIWRDTSRALDEHRIQHGCTQDSRNTQEWRSA